MEPRRLLFPRMFRKQRLTLLEGVLGISWMIGLVKIIEHSGYEFVGFITSAVLCCLLTGLVGSISVVLIAAQSPEDVTASDYLHGFFAGLFVLPGLFVVAILTQFACISLIVIIALASLYFLYLVCFTSKVTFGEQPKTSTVSQAEHLQALEPVMNFEPS